MKSPGSFVAQKRPEIGLEKLLKRAGARTELKRFRYTIKEMARTDRPPDYTLQYDEDRSVVVFLSRGTVQPTEELMYPILPYLDPGTYHHTRMAARRWDVHDLG